MVKEKKDRRIRKTENQLRAGLAKLMKEKNIREITVKELVEEVDINRSTFYLHYTDIYNMMSTIEEELMEDFRILLSFFSFTMAYPLFLSFFTPLRRLSVIAAISSTV